MGEVIKKISPLRALAGIPKTKHYKLSTKAEVKARRAERERKIKSGELRIYGPKNVNEELSMDDFISFASDHLKLKDKPKVKFVQEKEEDMSSACYNPADKSMKILSKGRRFMDIARSVAHEMVHQHQHERIGDPSKLDGSTGSPHEDEANAVAGRIIRMYGKKNPELYTEAFQPSRKKKLANRQKLRKSTERRVDLIRRAKYNDPEITSKYPSAPRWSERLTLMGLKESLAAEMDKSDDPYSFAAKMMKAQRQGDVELKRRGAASARELVAAWKKRQDRKKK